MDGYVHPDFTHAVDALRKQIPQDAPGGAALTVFHQGRCVVDVWGGTRNEFGDPWQQDTLSLSFSTTKGIASTVIHILVDQGVLDYDTPVAHYWPEFAQAGKTDLTLRHLLTHQAGLYNVRDLLDNADQLLDWDTVTDRLAAAAPAHAPDKRSGYHGLTYGYLIGEVARRATGKGMSQLVQELLAGPLDLDGLHIGLPDTHHARCADLITRFDTEKPVSRKSAFPVSPRTLLARKEVVDLLNLGLRFYEIDLHNLTRALSAKGIARMNMNSAAVREAVMPSMNGMFTARSLAKVYAALANGGRWEDTRLLSSGTMARATQLQIKTRDRVVPVRMHWRLGYHGVFNRHGKLKQAFGHFGFGGSGAWGDPGRGLGVAMTLNSGVGTPFGDWRIVKLSDVITDCADRRMGRPVPEKRGFSPLSLVLDR
jgi:CubicO group peptidase (beta-lactamase class C family)